MSIKRRELWEMAVGIACQRAGLSIAKYFYDSIMNYIYFMNVTFSGGVYTANRMEE